MKPHTFKPRRVRVRRATRIMHNSIYHQLADVIRFNGAPPYTNKRKVHTRA